MRIPKKVIAALLCVLCVGFAVSARADDSTPTLADLQAQIETLKTQISQLIALIQTRNSSGIVTNSGNQNIGATNGKGNQGQGVVGKVTANDGTTITMDVTQPGSAASVSYTVTASTTISVKKVTASTAGGQPTETTIEFSAVAAGDTISVRGTTTGTAIVATEIRDGAMAMGAGGYRQQGQGVRGTVTAVSGTTITMASKQLIKNSTTTTEIIYTVDASGATFKEFSKGNATSTVSTITIDSIAVGDTILVRGTVSGTAIVATEIVKGDMIMGGMGGGNGFNGQMPGYSR